MKKSLFSIIIPLAIFSLAIVMIGPMNAQATPVATPVACPSGYTCTPIAPQPVNCPAGYICTPTTPTPSQTPSPITIPQTPINSCYVWSTNLQIGSTGADVVALQTLLIANGYNIPDISSGQSSKGYFGQSTFSAVKLYQTANDIPNTGFVGPITRGALNGSCSSINPPSISFISVFSPNGNIWVRGTQQKILWTSNIGSDSKVDISLVREGTNDYYDISSVYNRALNTGSYTWEVGKTSDRGSMDRDGSYWVRICTPTRSVCNSGNGKVTMITSTTTQPCVSPNVWNGSTCVPPVTPINTSGYQKLPTDSNISGTASLASADEDKAFKWGAGQQIHGPDWKWLISITNSGSSAKTIKRMVVVHNTGGEGWATDASANNLVSKSLYTLATTQTTSCGKSCQPYTSYTDNIATPIPANSSMSFFAFGYPASQRFSGGYLLIEFTDGTSATINIPASSITPSTSSQITTSVIQPSITVLSPNGGESFAQGESLNVIWNSASPTQSVDVKILNSNDQVLSNPIQYNVRPSSSNAQSIGFATSPSIIPIGQYKARVCSSGTNNCDDSNSYFSIISPVSNVAPAISLAGPQPTSVGSRLSVYVANAGRQGNMILTTFDGSKTWSTGYAVDVTALNGFSSYDGSKLTITIPSTIGRGVNPGMWNEPTVPITNGNYKLYVTALDANNNFIKSNVIDVQIVNNTTQPPITGTQSITPSASTIDSGSSVKFNFTFPSNTVRASLYLACPTGVTEGTSKCNQYTDVTSNTDYTVILNNSSSQSQEVVPNYYIYTSDNPNYAKGITSQVTVKPGQATTVTTPNQTLTTSISAYLSDASADKAGTNFSPGLGIQNAWQNKNANDWHWRVIVKADANAKMNISSITINHNTAGEAWSTSDSRYYPLVVFKNGVQINTAYGNMVDISSAGTNTFDLYGQPETTTFSGGTITVKFGDGTSVSSSIPASNAKQITVSAQAGTTAAIWDAVREYYRNGGL
ncbi:MAG: peptidoglycan-binding domain-containing protein [Patescibacteria group bacterium]